MSAKKTGILSRLRVDTYLLLIVGMAVAASILPAKGAAAPVFDWATKIAIGLVFFLHGARLSREAVIGGLTHWRLHLVVLGATFALFPILCLGLAALPAWITPPALASGIRCWNSPLASSSSVDTASLWRSSDLGVITTSGLRVVMRICRRIMW